MKFIERYKFPALVIIISIIIIILMFIRKFSNNELNGLSDKLKLSILFNETATFSQSNFTITLKNYSRMNLNLKVDPFRYRGEIEFTTSDRNCIHLYDKYYMESMRTKLLPCESFLLKRGDSIVWKIPINNLSASDGRILPWSEKLEFSAVARLNELAIIANDRPYSSDNAARSSDKIYYK
jgi:hypothetical protein